MPSVPGKNGTVRMRGRFRAQIRVLLAKTREVLAYNLSVTQAGSLPPPLSAGSIATLGQVQTLCNSLLALKNPSTNV